MPARFKLLVLLLCAAPLTACGIKGDLDRAPPLWGGGSGATVPDDNSAATSIENADDPFDEPEDPFDGDPLEEDDDEVEYGVDVAD